ncbi:hypothetical protein BSL78_19159 [Apostichopus japonicus]|uniref:Reverse transcriptase domain-containing protein n=1 Tax=Stichopus japonicus TaxID=307972 RepID=A0A2G8K7J5_STIJA|nr:hypothetical protein BSL78_19159 [Apostichopus japonicus]
MGPPPKRYPCLWTTSSNLLFLRLILIHDTPDFLRKLEDIKTKSPVQPSSVLSTSLLFTLTSLMLKVSQPRVQPCLRRSTLVHPSLTSKFSCNRFSPKNSRSWKHYLQRHGTAMGTRMAPSYACLFMSSLEEHMLSTGSLSSLIWWRYIDDISSFGPVMRIACSPSSITSILSTAPSNSPLITLTNRLTFSM